jgi:hypothetical protein
MNRAVPRLPHPEQTALTRINKGSLLLLPGAVKQPKTAYRTRNLLALKIPGDKSCHTPPWRRLCLRLCLSGSFLKRGKEIIIKKYQPKNPMMISLIKLNLQDRSKRPRRRHLALSGIAEPDRAFAEFMATSQNIPADLVNHMLDVIDARIPPGTVINNPKFYLTALTNGFKNGDHNEWRRPERRAPERAPYPFSAEEIRDHIAAAVSRLENAATKHPKLA